MNIVNYRPKPALPERCIWVQELTNKWQELEYFCTHPCDEGAFCQLASEGHCYLYFER